MRKAQAANGVWESQLDPVETEFLSKLVKELQNMGHAPSLVASYLSTVRGHMAAISGLTPRLNQLEERLRSLETGAMMRPAAAPMPVIDLSDIHQEIADIRSTINELNPAFGAY